MSLTDCSYGSPHSIHRSSVAESRPPLLFAPKLWSLSKVKVVSFLMGLTLMFIVMVSYLLTWDKEGFLFTASPEQFRPVVILSSPLARAAPDVSSEGLSDMEPLVHTNINSKLEYTPRTLPDEKDVFEADSRVSLQHVICRSPWTTANQQIIIPCETPHNQPRSKNLLVNHIMSSHLGNSD